MLNKMITEKMTLLHEKIMKTFSRDWLEYALSNTTNLGTQKIDNFLWSYDCRAQLLAVRKETDLASTFVLLTNQNFTMPIAGQHIEITLPLEIDGEAAVRCYTVSAVRNNRIEITVKKQQGGKVSNWLHNNAKRGMLFNISLPRGKFVCPLENESDNNNNNGRREKLFISAGSGITPSYAMINQLLRLDSQKNINLFYRTQDSNNIIFKSELEKLSRNQNVAIHYSFSRGPSLQDNSAIADQLAELYVDIKQFDVYLCGPETFRDEVMQYLTSIEFDMAQFNFERFSLPESAPITAADSAKRFKQEVTVLLSSQNKEFTIAANDNDKTLLQAAEAQGINMEHGCRSGMCGSCRTQLVSGKVTGNQVGDSIYPCTAYANSERIILE